MFCNWTFGNETDLDSAYIVGYSGVVFLLFSSMDFPWVLRTAYFVGLNPYYNALSIKFFYIFGSINLLFNASISISIVYTLAEAGPDSFLIVNSISRVMVFICFVFDGLTRVDSS